MLVPSCNGEVYNSVIVWRFATFFFSLALRLEVTYLRGTALEIHVDLYRMRKCVVEV
jgi:hypothetical protein